MLGINLFRSFVNVRNILRSTQMIGRLFFRTPGG